MAYSYAYYSKVTVACPLSPLWLEEGPVAGKHWKLVDHTNASHKLPIDLCELEAIIRE